MTQSKATRSIIDTHRHIFGPKLRQKFVENIGFDDSKPLPQANAGEMFFYRESDGTFSYFFPKMNRKASGHPTSMTPT